MHLLNPLNRRWQFHDINLSTTVDAAFQALAIDEKRGPFQPTLWKQAADSPGLQQLEQVWFAGAHSDVGGGYPETGLSDIPLLWMVDRARRCGLVFAADAFTHRPSGSALPSSPDSPLLSRTYADPNPLGDLHESRKGFYGLIPPFVRKLGVNDQTHEYVASSAVERHKQMEGYAPSGLVAYLNGRPRMLEVEWEQS